jgi:hypothetical protein
MPTYKNVEAGFSNKPKITDPIPTFLENFRAMRDGDKGYTDYLLLQARHGIEEELVNRFLNELSCSIGKWVELFRYILSILRQWLVF